MATTKSPTLHVGTRVVGGKLVTMAVPNFQPSPKFAELIFALTEVIKYDFVYCPHVLAAGRDWAFPMVFPGAFCPRCAYQMPGWRRGEIPCVLCGAPDAGHVMLEVPLRDVQGGDGRVIMLGVLCRDCIVKETGLFASW